VPDQVQQAVRRTQPTGTEGDVFSVKNIISKNVTEILIGVLLIVVGNYFWTMVGIVLLVLIVGSMVSEMLKL
jgi:hypothetical protein